MTKAIQIRNVPDSLYRTIKAKAENAGLSISDYLLSELERDEVIGTRPTLSEMRRRLRRREPVSVPIDTARMVRDERDGR